MVNDVDIDKILHFSDSESDVLDNDVSLQSTGIDKFLKDNGFDDDDDHDHDDDANDDERSDESDVNKDKIIQEYLDENDQDDDDAEREDDEENKKYVLQRVLNISSDDDDSQLDQKNEAEQGIVDEEISEEEVEENEDEQKYKNMISNLSSSLNEANKEEKMTSEDLNVPDKILHKASDGLLNSSKKISKSSSSTNSSIFNKGDGWESLNYLLQEHGFAAIPLERVDLDNLGDGMIPKRSACIERFRDIVRQFEKRGQLIQDLVLDSDINSRKSDKTENNIQSAEKKHKTLEKSAAVYRSKIKELQEELSNTKKIAEKNMKKIKAENASLRLQVKHSEHRVKAQEVMAERLQQRIREQVSKEELSKSRDREVFRSLNKRDPRKANSKDSKTLETISIFENQREQMQQEINELQMEVRRLNGDIRDKENLIMRKDTGNSWKRTDHSELLERLENARREQEVAAMKLRQREESVVKKITSIEEDLAYANSRVHELEEENSNMQMELQSRPSIRDYRISQRRIHALENQLAESKEAIREANDLQELRKFMGTRELIHRDRSNFRLRLNRLDALPKESAIEVVKEVCRDLNLTDIALIGPSVRKMCDVMKAVPRMEKFIRDVLGFVCLDNLGKEGSNSNPDNSLEQVLPTLNRWVTELKEMSRLQEFKISVMSELLKRPIQPNIYGNRQSTKKTSNHPISEIQAISSIAQLVDMENSFLKQKDVYDQASVEITQRPELLINRIVQHFRYLFSVKHMEGVLPKMNEIYLFMNEMDNMLHVIRSILHLDSKASPNSCLAAIRKILDQRNEISRKIEPEDEDDSGFANYVVSKKEKGDNSLAGVQKVRQMDQVINELHDILGTDDDADIVARAKSLVDMLNLN